MAKYIELIDKYRIEQGEGDYNPPSYVWVDNTGEIVRCRECKHRDPETKGCDCAGHEMVMGGIIPMPDNWFCADGRRKVQE